MLKNIKSKFIIKIILSYANERIKLKIIKHNKSLQNNINISIIHYKYFSGKKLIYESNGIGKIFDAYYDKLIFEGKFINGEKYGKGIEYDCKGNKLFEGEFLDGKRNGEGKEYYLYNNLYFEGEYLDEQRNGKGKEYYYDGKLKFEGEYLYDKEWNGTKYDMEGNIKYKLTNSINGKGKEYNYDDNLIFEGEYLNGKRNGEGKEYYNNGKLKYEGEYFNDKRNGKGKEYYYNGKLKYKGEYLNDKRWNGLGYDSLNNVIYELKDGKGFVKE